MCTINFYLLTYFLPVFHEVNWYWYMRCSLTALWHVCSVHLCFMVPSRQWAVDMTHRPQLFPHLRLSSQLMLLGDRDRVVWRTCPTLSCSTAAMPNQETNCNLLIASLMLYHYAIALSITSVQCVIVLLFPFQNMKTWMSTYLYYASFRNLTSDLHVCVGEWKIL